MQINKTYVTSALTGMLLAVSHYACADTPPQRQASVAIIANGNEIALVAVPIGVLGKYGFEGDQVTVDEAGTTVRIKGNAHVSLTPPTLVDPVSVKADEIILRIENRP